MSVAVNKLLRFPAGETLAFTCTLSGPWVEALLAAKPELRRWVDPAGALRASVERADQDGCALRVQTADGDTTIRVERSDAGQVVATVDTLAGDAPLERIERDRLAIMLGGVRDAYLAVRDESGTRILLRLRYTADEGSCSVALFTAAFKERVSAHLVALLPTEITCGRIESAAAARTRSVN